MHILGVRVDNISKEDLFEKIERYLSEPKFHQIATTNPEFILEAQKNEKFRNILNNCDLCVADGFGVKLAFWRYGKKLKARMAGADLMIRILKIANEKKLKVFLAINKDGLSRFEEIRSTILKIYPDLAIEGANLEKGIESPIGDSIPKDVLLCNFGAPYQETFLNCQKNGTIRLAMGIGGSFDFLTGKISRAPKIIRQAGLEWFWRLIQQPQRWKRVWNAVIIFPIKVLWDGHTKNPD